MILWPPSSEQEATATSGSRPISAAMRFSKINALSLVVALTQIFQWLVIACVQKSGLHTVNDEFAYLRAFWQISGLLMNLAEKALVNGNVGRLDVGNL